MDWSPESVLDFGPMTHRRGVRWARRRNLLWPVYAWQVVAPEPRERSLNVLQRAVLRLHVTGTREHVKVGALLGIDPELVAFIAEELRQSAYIDEEGKATGSGREELDESERGVGDMRVGWVFQDTWRGRLLPRFVTHLDCADVEMDDEGNAWVIGGTKGDPTRHRAYVVRPGDAPAIAPQPIDVLEAARRHRRQERRLQKAALDLEAVPAERVEEVSLVADEPELVHLYTFMYVPEELEQEDELWYVADPFGFGASPELREQIDALRSDGRAGLRKVLDDMTGEAVVRQRDSWRVMQDLLRDEARREVDLLWPRGVAEGDGVRERIVLAFEEIARLKQDEGGARDVGDRIDGPYLKLRQALELGLQTLREECPPRDAWRKLFDGDRPIPRDAAQETIAACAQALGFKRPTASGLVTPNAGKVKAACLRADSANLRPLCVAFLLAATDDESHPLRRLGAAAPEWFDDVNAVAEAAGAEVHSAKGQRSLEDLRRDAESVVRLCQQLLTAIVESVRLQ